MNRSDIIESFDSLWFFSNVVSSPKTEQSSHAVNEDAVKEEAPNPMNYPIEEQRQNEAPSPENFVPKCPKYGEFVKEEVEEFAEPEEEKRKNSSSRRRRRRQGRSKRSSRKILGELDHLHLGFDHGNYMDFGLLFDDEEKIIGSGQSKQVLGRGSEYHHHHPMNMKMPPLEDNVAMKEHLKSWAYAVACTVR